MEQGWKGEDQCRPEASDKAVTEAVHRLRTLGQVVVKIYQSNEKELGLPPKNPGDESPAEANESAGPGRIQPAELWAHANKTVWSRPHICEC